MSRADGMAWGVARRRLPDPAPSTIRALLRDTFVGADGTPLSSHVPTPDGIGAWTNLQGALALNGAGAARATTETGSISTINAGVADYAASADFAYDPTGNDQFFGIYFRLASLTNYWVFQVFGATDNIVLTKTVNNVTTTLVNTPFPTTHGATYSVKVVCNGTSIACTVNGVQVATATDSFNSTVTTLGIGVRRSFASVPLTTISNFLVTLP